MQLPKRIDKHVTESKSYKIFSNVLSDDWIIRDVTERDYGVDCYVEICESGFVTGRLLSIQLKGSKNIEIREDGKYATLYNINPSTFNYWNNLPMPVILAYIDINLEKIYFINIKKYIRENYKDFCDENLTNIKIPSELILKKEYSHIILNIIYMLENNRLEYENILMNFITSISGNVDLLAEHHHLESIFSY